MQLASEDPALFEAWLVVLTDDGREGDSLSLIVPTRYHASYVATHLTKRVLAAVRRANSSIRSVRLRSDGK